ncbi:MAG: type I polyketide synthase [Cyanobacteria bacterium P01_G01_bin.39]
MSDYLDSQNEEGIAIIGMDGRFPGANNVAEFWHNLRNGVESITFFSDEELIAAGVPSETVADPNYVKAGAILSDVDLFDADFFGISPREAQATDPQHRLLLECAWGALESAGQDSENYDGRIGVYVGSSLSTYLHQNLLTNPNFIKSTGDLQIEIGNDKDFVPTRISYKLNLTGPSVCINTACSTSLVSVHIACQGLLDRECDMALAGGATISLPQTAGYFHQEDSVASPDGHCRPFDADAKGTIFGSGVGIVVLKRLEDAIADRDPILAVIKGSAINNDGSLKVGYTAPSVDGQADAIAEAQEIAEIDPETISYIENHGTGTTMGDPIEIAALTKVFRSSTDKTRYCAIGSVKGNMGHLNRASGAISLIKTVLALKHQEIPPSINYQQPNPQINFTSSPFYVNTELQPWHTNGVPRRAGVSSFGIGGTNAHVILEEAPVREPSSPSRPWQLLLLSAKSESALVTAAQNLAQHLEQHVDLNLGDVAYTLQVGRRGFKYRQVVVCQNGAEAVTALQNTDFLKPTESKKRTVAFMFSGQGAQYVNMGQELYQEEPIFREQVDYCCELLKPRLGLDLRDILYPETDKIESATQQLTETRFTQPALFIIEYATARLWMAWGIKPKAAIGHSIGEYVAACIAGVFSLEDALMLVAERGQLMQKLPSGSMLSVFLPEAEVKTLLNDNLDLAVLNAPGSCVVSGTHEAIDTFEQQLTNKEIDCRPLHTSHAFHSSMMEPILATFTERVSQVALNPPQIPYISNVSGTWVTPESATNPSYWAKHLRSEVRFAAGAKELLSQKDCILLEVGPGKMLKSLALKQADEQVVLSSLRHPKEDTSDQAFILNTLGQLWQAGVEVDWSAFYQQEKRNRLSLPTYPFERKRYWVEAKDNLLQLSPGGVSSLVDKLAKTGEFDPQELQLLPKLLETLGKTELEVQKASSIEDWFYEVQWSAKPMSAQGSQVQPDSWLILADNKGIGCNLATLLKAEGKDSRLVFSGQQYQQISDSEFAIEPNSAEDLEQLGKALDLDNTSSIGIVHLWSLDTVDAQVMTVEDLKDASVLSCRSTLNLVQYLVNSGLSDSCSLCLVTKGAQAVVREGNLPGLSQAPLWGMGKVISLEHPELNCVTVDLDPELKNDLAPVLLAEIWSNDSEDRVAFRNNTRYVPRIVRKDLEKTKVKSKNLFHESKSYLITGGLKGLGLFIAGWMAQRGAKHLVLLGRSEPSKNTKEKITELENAGVQVVVAQADVTQEEQIAKVIRDVDSSVSPLGGIIHAAGILDDGVLQQLDWSRFARVMAPKVQGAWNLHSLTKEKSLEFFVMFSSTASLLGSLGQTNYVAANTFLDTLTHYRQTQGLPGLTINWGGWASIGMAADNQIKIQGMEPIVPELALQALERLLFNVSAQVGVVPIDWSKFSQKFSSGNIPPFFEELIGQEQPIQDKQVSVKDIKQANSSERESLLVIYVQERVSQALGINAKQLDIQQPLTTMGLDSLMAVQLRNLFKTDLGVNLLMSQFMNEITVASLAKLCGEQLTENSVSPTVESNLSLQDDQNWLEGEL